MKTIINKSFPEIAAISLESNPNEILSEISEMRYFDASGAIAVGGVIDSMTASIGSGSYNAAVNGSVNSATILYDASISSNVIDLNTSAYKSNDTIDLSGSFAFGVLFKHQISTMNQNLMGMFTSSSDRALLNIGANGASAQFQMMSVNANPGSMLIEDGWNLAIASYNAETDTMTAWCNGVAVTATQSAQPSFSGTFYVGALGGTGSQPCRGDIAAFFTCKFDIVGDLSAMNALLSKISDDFEQNF